MQDSTQLCASSDNQNDVHYETHPEAKDKAIQCSNQIAIDFSFLHNFDSVPHVSWRAWRYVVESA
jgi:hypothetical protein